MLTNFMLILKFFVLLTLHFGRYASESGAHEFLDRRLLRQERIDEGLCEVDSDENDGVWDLCYSNTTFAPKDTHCMCDDLCEQYKDCCVDKIIDESLESLDFTLLKSDSCIELFSNGLPIAAVYGIDRCDNNWIETNSGIKDKCELDAQQFESTGDSYSYLQDIPVLSEKFMYRNVFCAVCNNDSYPLKTWNISIDCDGQHLNIQNLENNMSPKNYNPLTKKWKVFLENNKSINCSISVNQLKEKQFFKDNNLRKCKKTIDECPETWKNDIISQKCDSYASYVYEDNKAYKNFHCALCNGASIGYIECFPNTTGIFRDYSNKTLWFPLLLDFNFAGDKGQWVGGEQRCPQKGQFYDPLYEKCLSVDSSKVDFSSKCFAFSVLENKKDFEILENNSIYINNQKSLLNESYYELFEENNVTKLRICRNESQLIEDSFIRSPFDIGQIILSEISLYTSIFCLTLHLIIYIIVPKLRNLPGKNLMSLSSALLLGHISFAMASYVRADRKIVCVLIAITIHYSYLAAFFWMSIMAFDICKTFRKTSRRSKGSNRYRFLKYSLYGWLSPAFIVIISAAFDIGFEGHELQPLYGYRFCWISQRQALLAFFAFPVFLIVCLNVLLFSLTAIGLVKTEEQTKILNKRSNKIRYFLYIKLAFIMGLTWAFGFVAALTDLKVLWYPFIIFNGLQGTAIFIAFSCKTKVFNLLAERFGFKRVYRSTTSDVIRSATGSTSLQTSTLVPSSPDSNVTKIKFTK